MLSNFLARLRSPRSKSTYDVVICGGGLAGSSLARQLKRQMGDLSILVVDKYARPLPEAAFKVGESTVEIGAHYLSEVLGLTDYFESKHLHKLGLRYFFGDSRGPLQDRPEFGLSTFAPVFSYQVDRGQFENDLRALNVEAGIELAEGCHVRDIVLGAGDAPHQVTFVPKEGRVPRTVHCRWVVDAMSRRRLIQKKLGLDRASGRDLSAAWFRLEGRIDLSDLVPQSERAWHDRVPDRRRYYSTVHLMGEGYWVWLIPLAGNNTSFGIVADESVHSSLTYNTYERAFAWLEQYEPVLAEHIRGREPLDFMRMRDYAHSSTQVFSNQRWACVGEAGVFADPFYSPGSDLIGFANTLTTNLIERERQGEAIQAAADHANFFFLGYNEAVTNNIQVNYSLFGNGTVMAAKLLWDYVAYWSFNAPQMYNSIFLDAELGARIRKLSGRYFYLSHRMQQLCLDWVKRSRRRVDFEFIDYLAVPFIGNLRVRNLKEHKSEQELLEDCAANMEVVEELAQFLFLLAVEDTMPEESERFIAPVWLNAWAIGLDASRWEADGLFKPTTRPRNLQPIVNELQGLFKVEQPHSRWIRWSRSGQRSLDLVGS